MNTTDFQIAVYKILDRLSCGFEFDSDPSADWILDALTDLSKVISHPPLALKLDPNLGNVVAKVQSLIVAIERSDPFEEEEYGTTKWLADIAARAKELIRLKRPLLDAMRSAKSHSPVHLPIEPVGPSTSPCELHSPNAIKIGPFPKIGTVICGPKCYSVRWGLTLWTFNQVQARIVDLLLSAYLDGIPELAEEYLLDQAGSKAKVLRTPFKRNNSKAFSLIIRRGSHRELFRLNLPG